MAAVQAPGCEKVYLNVSIISSGNPALFLIPYENGLHIKTTTFILIHYLTILSERKNHLNKLKSLALINSSGKYGI